MKGPSHKYNFQIDFCRYSIYYNTDKMSKSQKYIFLFSYYFPPYGGIRVLRNYYFADYLLKNTNYKIIIITSNYISDGMNDFDLYDKLDKTRIKIIPLASANLELLFKKYLFNKKKKTTNNNNNNKENKFIKKIINSFFIPDHYILYVIINFLKILNLYNKYNPTIIITSSPPHSIHIIGLLLKKIFSNKLKWLADFRDPWIGHKPYVSSFKLPHKIHNYLEYQTIKYADKVISCVNEILNNFKNKYSKIPDTKYKLIMNGYDENYFPSIKTAYKIIGTNINLHYTGTFNAWRTPELIIKGLKAFDLLQNNYSITFNIWGAYPQSYSYLPQTYSFNNVNINFNSHISYTESLQKMKNADINLLIVSKREGALVVTGKFSNYLAAGKPILALLPEQSVLENIINKNGFGIAVTKEDENMIGNAILDIIKNYTDYSTNFIIKSDYIHTYSRKFQNAELLNNI